MSTIRAVFFDFGDTLAELSPSREELFLDSAQSVGLALAIDSVRRAYQVVDSQNKYSSVHTIDRDSFYRRYNERLCETLGISSHFAQLGPVLLERFRVGKRWVLMDDTAETLHHLQDRGIPLALVSNWDANLAVLTEELGIRDFFSTIVSSQRAGVEKPDPAIFMRAAADLSLSLESDAVLYVGNEYRADVVGARAAGLTPVLIDRRNAYQHADCLRFPSLRQWVISMR